MNKNDCIIRPETKDDYRAVENLAREAFWNLSVPGCGEHYFIHVMRNHKDFIPELDVMGHAKSENGARKMSKRDFTGNGGIRREMKKLRRYTYGIM